MKTIRIIIPAFPEINIFTRQAKKTTALGPIIIATVINKLMGFRVEVIDENNYRGERGGDDLPDHSVLQKNDPAVVVGFYCGLTSTMERVWKLAEFYKQQGVHTIAGAWHAHYCPEETLNNNIDVVIHGDAELVVNRVISALVSGCSLEEIPGVSFKTDEGTKRNKPDMLEDKNIDDLPDLNFGLLRFAKIRTYPIGRIRGCSMGCEFCSVKGKPRYASADYLFNTVRWLVETRGARRFFIVDDRSEEDPKGTAEFFKKIADTYGNKLCFSVQIRLETAKNIPLLEIMKKGGVRYVCVGYESPIDEDLKAMNKRYLSSDMIGWTKILRRYFWVHGMFIVGYPPKEGQISIKPKEIVKIYKWFIRKAGIDSIQVLLPVPIVGTKLRERLGDRVFPLDLVPWRFYDGNYPCFKPDNMTLKELQWIGVKLMKGFYRRRSIIRIGLRTIVFPLDFFIRGWGVWRKGWERDIINFSGHILVRKWLKKQESKRFIDKLEK